jgi:hypothetical protein
MDVNASVRDGPGWITWDNWDLLDGEAFSDHIIRQLFLKEGALFFL